MRSFSYLSALTVLCLLMLSSCSGAPDRQQGQAGVPTDGQWLTNYNQALLKASSESKRVMLDFTGSDWCGWCKKLDGEIFQTQQFKDYARENLVLVELDFPRNKHQPRELKEQNQKLQQEYGIKGYPTLIILDSTGNKIGEMGYMRGGPAPFIKALDKIR